MSGEGIEEAISSVLSNPEEMEKLMAMAKTIGGSLGAGEPAPEAGSGPDPKIMGLVGRIMGSCGTKNSDKRRLVEALKPFLKPERWQALDRAARIAGLAGAAQAATRELGADYGL
ncbi:MAG: hypothetical protein II794_02870 [Oscillospiraceae bacterium]|nr:hypothetical protein [Oscillospiraceae bacterium]